MRLIDQIGLALDDMRLMKLRSILTISGVVIAIAAFVAMLSFAAGNKRYIGNAFDRLGLFSTMVVYPGSKNVSDTDSVPAVLTDSTLIELTALPGVALAFPYNSFKVTVSGGDSVFTTEAQTIPHEILQSRIFSQVQAGEVFASDSSNQIMVTEQFLRSAGIRNPDSAIGLQMIISSHLVRLDSGLVNVVNDRDESIRERLRNIALDSMFNTRYRVKIIRQEISAALGRFFDGYMNHRDLVADTFTICGVLDGAIQGGRLRIRPVIMPYKRAIQYNPGGFDGDPEQLFSTLTSGISLNTRGGVMPEKTYPQVTLILSEDCNMAALKDSITTRGYGTFSFVDRFKEIERFFVYYELALSAIGMMALVIASLGIINTMVMSIIERTREIGILISLGADQSDIHRMFLVQSGVIGFVGAVFGIIFGWLGTRIVAAIAQHYIQEHGVEAIDFFAFPPWLLLAATGLGVIVSLLAGWYPSARAARIDPVKALRNE